MPFLKEVHISIDHFVPKLLKKSLLNFKGTNQRKGKLKKIVAPAVISTSMIVSSFLAATPTFAEKLNEDLNQIHKQAEEMDFKNHGQRVPYYAVNYNEKDKGRERVTKFSRGHFGHYSIHIPTDETL